MSSLFRIAPFLMAIALAGPALAETAGGAQDGLLIQAQYRDPSLPLPQWRQPEPRYYAEPRQYSPPPYERQRTYRAPRRQWDRAPRGYYRRGDIAAQRRYEAQQRYEAHQRWLDQHYPPHDERDRRHGGWRTAPEPEPRQQQRRIGGDERDGGPRPSIAALAPPTVAFINNEAPGTIIIVTEARMLYYTISSSEAYAYPVAVGREGFGWHGSETVSRVASWPDWHPPESMRQRQPELPKKMTGGINNPLGARAIYLGDTLYRIHGTNEDSSIGQAASSGCFRMRNEHVVHLAEMVEVGAKVRVVESWPGATAQAGG